MKLNPEELTTVQRALRVMSPKLLPEHRDALALVVMTGEAQFLPHLQPDGARDTPRCWAWYTNTLRSVYNETLSSVGTAFVEALYNLEYFLNIFLYEDLPRTSSSVFIKSIHRHLTTIEHEHKPQ